jgi:hypothetical protein
MRAVWLLSVRKQVVAHVGGLFLLPTYVRFPIMTPFYNLCKVISTPADGATASGIHVLLAIPLFFVVRVPNSLLSTKST